MQIKYLSFLDLSFLYPQFVYTLNNLEQVFQCLAALQGDFNLDQEDEQDDFLQPARVSVSSMASSIASSNHEDSDVATSPAPAATAASVTPAVVAGQPLMQNLMEALDHVDMIAYTLLESLQPKVTHK